MNNPSKPIMHTPLESDLIFLNIFIDTQDTNKKNT